MSITNVCKGMVEWERNYMAFACDSCPDYRACQKEPAVHTRAENIAMTPPSEWVGYEDLEETTPFDMCGSCDIPDNPLYGDPESENTFTCADCSCGRCEYRHACSGQCAEVYRND